MAGNEFTIEIKKPETLVLLAFLGILLVMELQVSLSTPISFGDEGFHTGLAQWIGQNVEYPTWVPFTQNLAGKAAFDRPPFWNILEGGLFWLFGFSEMIPRLLTPFISVLGGLALYLGAKRFYGERVSFIAAVMLATFPSVVTYALVFYTDALTTFFMEMFVITLAIAFTDGRRMYMMAAGAFGALTLLTKVVGYTAYALVGMMLLYELFRNRKPADTLKKYWPLLLVMALLPATHMLRNYAYFGTPLCYDLPVVSNLFSTAGCSIDTGTYKPTYSYAGRTQQVGTETDVFSMGIVNYLDFAYGNTWLVLVAFFAGVILLVDPIREGLAKGLVMPEIRPFDFALIGMLALYVLLFLFGTITPRAEDTARFSLMWAPVIALVAAKFLDEAYLFVRKYQKYVALAVFGVVMFLGWGVAMYKIATMSQVKQFSPLFFEACGWVKSNVPQDAIISTVWTYRTAYSCQRNVAGSSPDMALSNNVTLILETAKEIGITHIFVQKFSLSDQSLSETYPVSYVQLLSANPDHFKKVFENGISLDQCIQQGGCDGNILFQVVY
ncbi:MAG: glycosyltransferase family 39 protein [Candidatus Aenigmarchaeota archaeon]|nr:glycosyltransferase family 39 protein [Candidatus Aenigmarchaeota archaeon]